MKPNSRHKPEYYKTPLKKRDDIAAFIILNTSQRHYHCSHPLCFNVKCHSYDLSFDNLLKRYQEQDGEKLHHKDEEWLKAAKERFEETGEDNLWEWGREQACEDFQGGSDMYNHLWDGTPVDVTYSFEGRCCGWLSINKFQGYNFCNGDQIAEMEYSKLRQLYQLIVMLLHDTKNPDEQIEFNAAFAFFANVASDIPEPDAIQLKLQFAE